MSAILTAESGDVETIGIMVNECKRMGIDVLPPSVNESYSQFTVVSTPGAAHKIRFGLTTIKNFGAGISSSITAERKKNGPFVSLADFLSRVKDKNLNKKSLEALIKSGAMDEFGERGQLMANLDTLLGFHKEISSAPDNQHSLFALFGDEAVLPKLRLAEAPEATKKEKLIWEKELLGLYISGHPLEEFKEKLSKLEGGIKKLDEYNENHECVVAGIITSSKELVTKKGDRMAFVRLEDFSGSLEVVVFPKVYEEFKSFLTLENCVAMKGKVSKRNNETSFMADKIKAL
jgi:DNA polymerase-3 subunit alpha